MSKIQGFKVFNLDWTCRDMQYKVGKTYKLDGELQMCHNGFHFCKKAADCFRYYDFDSNNKVAEVEAIGQVITNDEDSKCVTDKIKIVREISWHEVLDLVNTGKDNTGLGNSGDSNSGDSNSGYRNSGYSNSGYRNSGDSNSGDRNSGYRNSGYRNSGCRNSGNSNSGNSNSGNSNSGNSNSGDFNSCDFSSGVFCTETPKLLMFDKPTNMTLRDWFESEPCNILRKFTLTKWICEEDMTDEEKEEHKEYETTGGYLKQYTYKEAWKNLWDSLDIEEKDIVQRLPNFDKDKFKEITGLEV